MNEKEKTEKTVLIMACSVMGVGFTYLFLVTFFTIPDTGVEHAKTITGFILGVTISSLINYYWGSSKGSASKSETIDKELGGLNPSPTSTTSTSHIIETVDKRKTETVTEPEVKPEVKP